MASETIIYLHQKGIQLAQDIDLVSFVDYDSDVYALYANQMDSIIQPGGGPWGRLRASRSSDGWRCPTRRSLKCAHIHVPPLQPASGLVSFGPLN